MVRQGDEGGGWGLMLGAAALVALALRRALQ